MWDRIARSLVRRWLARQGVGVEWIGPDLRAAADTLDHFADYGRIPQTVRAVAQAIHPA